jgi:hypothetical protein
MSTIDYQPPSSPILGPPYPRGFRPLSPLDDIDDHAVPFAQSREPGARIVQ